MKPFRPVFDPGLAAIALTQQPFLLDFATSYGSFGGDAANGREFQVAIDAMCYGLRVKLYGAQTCNIRLWRTDTATQVAEELGLAAAVGTNLLLFSTPIAINSVLTYRISCARVGLPFNLGYYIATSDHPDGPVTILSSNSYCWRASDAYPSNVVAGWSWACEPIIYA